MKISNFHVHADAMKNKLFDLTSISNFPLIYTSIILVLAKTVSEMDKQY